MSLVEVDADRCILCGACLEECPFQLLEMVTPESPPAPRAIPGRSAHERCINCGHCMAVCPTAALIVYPIPHATIPGAVPAPVAPERQAPEDCRPIRRELEVSPEQVDQQLMSRRSHRAYDNRQVPRETLEEVIRVASYAPTPHNSQLARWLVISDRVEIKRVAQGVIDFMKASIEEAAAGGSPAWDYRGTDSDVIVDLWEKGEDSIFRGAPHVIIIYGPKLAGGPRVPELQFSINATFLELAACARGLATVWVGYLMAAFDLWPPMAELVKLPPGQEMYAVLGVGYPRNVYRRIPLRNQPQITWR